MAINKRIIKSNDGGVAVPTSFNTVLYTGNSSTQSITGLGFEPDLVWIKGRYDVNHRLIDSVRGATQILFPSSTAAEDTSSPLSLTSFDTNGFTLGANSNVNFSGSNYVAWCWKAGGAAVTNTDGDLTSQVSANTEAGFSIVNYTGNDVSGNISVGHGLGITPKIVIQKNRSISSNWEFQTTIIDGSNDFLYLNDTRAAGNASQLSPESDVFWIRKDQYVNQNNSSNQYINYCFAEVAGFSKFGSHTTAAKITTGFEPAWVMIKYTGTTSDWWIMDLARWDGTSYGSNGGKLIKPYLEANTSDAEGSVGSGSIEVMSDGFYPTNFFNAGGAIHMAFANQF